MEGLSDGGWGFEAGDVWDEGDVKGEDSLSSMRQKTGTARTVRCHVGPDRACDPSSSHSPTEQ